MELIIGGISLSQMEAENMTTTAAEVEMRVAELLGQCIFVPFLRPNNY